MKKKLILTALSSVLALGVLGACGEMENNEPVENDPMMEENNGMNEDGMNNDGDM
jgi:hypothetical protein